MDTTEKFACLRQAAPVLADWYRANARMLPWREEPSPYRVWISEIMLQQTRIEAVKPYFQRFLEALPDLPALAAAPEEQVLKLWEGLGYYSRARNLQKAAQVCVEEYGGELPSDYERLRKLPGIGNYTAGAIASIAWGQPAAAVDGNVLRVLARLFADETDIARPAVRREAEEMIRQVLQEGCAAPGDFNQGIMELGETLCIPGGAPSCGECPWRRFCAAGRQGTAERYPVKAPKKPRRVEEWTVLRLETGGKTAVRRRPAKGLLAGLYEFPALEGRWTEEQVRRWLSEQDAPVVSVEDLGPARHVFSHVEWHMTGYRILLEREWQGDWRFVPWEELKERCPLPTALRAYGNPPVRKEEPV